LGQTDANRENCPRRTIPRVPPSLNRGPRTGPLKLASPKAPDPSSQRKVLKGPNDHRENRNER